MNPKPRVQRKQAVLSPVLLLGGGRGEASCGILYLASYLRRHGVEAYVRLSDACESDEELERTLRGLLKRVRPKLVGLSLKWFHHLHHTLTIARMLKRLDPSVRVVVGGNSASFWWQELLGHDCVDDVVLGDGEVPLLALCRQQADPPNCAHRGPDGKPRRAGFGYIQGADSREVYYSHFDELFLSQLDRDSFSGWVAPGKGCGANCLYCGGGRGSQKAEFGRAVPFVRPVATVRRDLREIEGDVWQFRYDFGGGTAAFMTEVWKGFDFSRHSTTYFLWGAPPRALIELLARTFGRVYMVLDIGCFSQSQRTELTRRGLLKPCPTDAELLHAVELCRAHPNLRLEVSGIAGLPLMSAQALEEEQRLVRELLGRGSAVAYQRLEAQPGALVTHHPERFGMVTEAKSFEEFLQWFDARHPALDDGVPMVRFADPALEEEVQQAADEIQLLLQGHTAAEGLVTLDGSTRLVNQAASTRRFTLSDWFGSHLVPGPVAKQQVTVVRSLDGAGLSLAPGVGARAFSDPSLHQGKEGAAILAVLEAFEQPREVDEALRKLRAEHRLGAGPAREIVDHLAAGRFLGPA